MHLADDEAVRTAYARIADNVRRAGIETLDAMLVCQQISGGLELVLGLNRDPEMGLVVMAGSGGVLLELTKDVAFAAPPLTREKARAMIERTHAARLLRGYRSSPVLDTDAVIDALVALGRIAEDLADVVQSIDINPFVVLPRGGFALDALVVPLFPLPLVGRGRGGGREVMRRRQRSHLTSRPPPLPPHKGEGADCARRSQRIHFGEGCSESHYRLKTIPTGERR